MPARRRYDWELIKRDFVEGIGDRDGEIFWPNQREISELHHVPYKTVRERAAKEGWSEQRSAYQSHVERVRQSKRAEHLAQEAVEIDSTALRMAKVGMQLVVARLTDVAKAVAAQQREREQAEREAREAGQEEDTFVAVFAPSIDAREQEQLARAATQWHALAGRSIGEVPTTRQEVTGADGAPLMVGGIFAVEDDPQRVYDLYRVFERSGLLGDPEDEPGGEAGAPPEGDS